ncbi:MAG: hypothetical protein ACM3PP_08615 [Candidatus Saccharibacteria bacterium]
MEILANPAVAAILKVLMVFVAIYVFLKFCGFAKQFTWPKKLKQFVYLLTTLGVIGFNWMFSAATEGTGAEATIKHGADGLMTIAVVSALACVFLFSFALMTETKAD